MGVVLGLSIALLLNVRLSCKGLGYRYWRNCMVANQPGINSTAEECIDSNFLSSLSLNLLLRYSVQIRYDRAGKISSTSQLQSLA